MLIVTVVDLSAGPGVGFLPLVSLGPAFAGLIGAWRHTAAIARWPWPWPWRCVRLWGCTTV